MERAKDAHRRRSQAQVPMAHVSLVFRRIHAMNWHDGMCMYTLLHMILYDCIILHLRISKIIYCTCFCLEVENQSSVLVFSIYTSLLHGAAWVGQQRSIAIAPQWMYAQSMPCPFALKLGTQILMRFEWENSLLNNLLPEERKANQNWFILYSSMMLCHAVLPWNVNIYVNIECRGFRRDTSLPE